MNKFLFVLLSSLSAGLASGVISAVASWIYTKGGATDHAHQIVPTWLVLFVLGFLVSFVCGIIGAIYFVYNGQTPFLKVFSAATIAGIVAIGTLALIF